MPGVSIRVIEEPGENTRQTAVCGTFLTDAQGGSAAVASLQTTDRLRNATSEPRRRRSDVREDLPGNLWIGHARMENLFAVTDPRGDARDGYLNFTIHDGAAEVPGHISSAAMLILADDSGCSPTEVFTANQAKIRSAATRRAGSVLNWRWFCLA